jgi:hypothetical protein
MNDFFCISEISAYLCNAKKKQDDTAYNTSQFDYEHYSFYFVALATKEGVRCAPVQSSK